MPKALRVKATEDWWRHDRYEICDDLIRPAPGAALSKYDPWEAFYRDEAGSQRPYIELANIFRDQVSAPVYALGEDGDGSLPLADGVADRLVAWCNQNGLLGFLLDRLASFSIGPMQATSVPNEYDQQTWVRVPPGWYPLSGRRQIAPDFVANDYGVALLSGALDHAPRYAPLRESIWPYFPGVPPAEADTYNYPQPLTKRFFEGYAEPVAQFLICAHIFGSAIEEFARSSSSKRRLPRAFPFELQTLLARVTPTISIDDGGEPHLAWSCGSLLGTLAMMLLLDITGNRQPYICASCGKLFATGRGQVLYCSDTCRWRAQKRRWRVRHNERKRQEEEESRKGSRMRTSGATRTSKAKRS